MSRRLHRSIWGAGIGVAVFGSVILALRDGLDGGYSGGPAGDGRTCTVCHGYNEGPGGVELLGLPQRYRAGDFYDLTVRVADPEQAGAGFQISAEGADGHSGSWTISDSAHTDFSGSGFDPTYVVHTEAGVDDAVSQWPVNGGSYDYHVRWTAPHVDVGPITFFLSGNAINNAGAFLGDRYYAARATIAFAVPGDADGDTDVDLGDAASLQRCFDAVGTDIDTECRYLDLTRDGLLSLLDLAAFVDDLSGPTAEFPAGYILADVVRGGQLFDRWWQVLGAPAPAGTHPLYPPAGVQSGSVTFRCKECHGWDYKGRDGQYGSGSHFTGVRGVFGTMKTPQDIFDLLRADPVEVPNGHDMVAYGMTARDLWDVTKWVREGVIDTSPLIAAGGTFVGDEFSGEARYATVCASCHGFDGRNLNFGTESQPEYVGNLANDNPWEFLHKTRFGQPGTPMQAVELLNWDATLAADVGSYAASLPTE